MLWQVIKKILNLQGKGKNTYFEHYFCDIHIQFNGYRLLLKYRKGENFRCICFVVYFLWFLHILFFCYFGELIDFHYDGDVLLVK